MAGIRQLLTPDGTFVFDTSYGAAVVRETLIDTVYHEHLSYFMARPLESFFARHGMELIDVLPVPNKGGSIRGIASSSGGPRPFSPRVAEMVAAELAAGLDRPDPYRAFARRLTEVTDRLGELIAAEHAAGGRVAGYGASVGSVTLVHQFRLGTVLDFIADDKPLAETLLPQAATSRCPPPTPCTGCRRPRRSSSWHGATPPRSSPGTITTARPAAASSSPCPSHDPLKGTFRHAPGAPPLPRLPGHDRSGTSDCLL